MSGQPGSADRKRSRNIRKRKAAEKEQQDSDEEDTGSAVSLRDKLQATKLLQKQRERYGGIGAKALLSAPAADHLDEEEVLPAGGAGDLLPSYVKEQKKEDDDIDPHMQKYIDEQMAKRLGKQQQEEGGEAAQQRQDDEDELYRIPEELKGAKVKASDPAGAWVTGILEVELPMEYKLKNIEETEAAKKRLLRQTGLEATSDGEDGDGDDAATALHRAQYPRDFGHENPKLAQVRVQKLKAFRKQRA